MARIFRVAGKQIEPTALSPWNWDGTSQGRSVSAWDRRGRGRVPGTTRSKDCPHVDGRQQFAETRQMSDESQDDDNSARAYEAVRRLVEMFTRYKANLSYKANLPGSIVSHRYVMRRISERDRRLETAKLARTNQSER
jgi:hypothetical protein